MTKREIPGSPSAALQLGRWRLLRSLRRHLCRRVNILLCDPALTYDRMMELIELKPQLLVYQPCPCEDCRR